MTHLQLSSTMDTKAIRNALIDLYNSTIGKSVDTKTLNYLTMSVSKGENSLENITETLVNTDEYRERMRGLFSALHYDLIGISADDEGFNAFWTAQQKTDKKTLVNNVDMELFIRKLSTYCEKYTEIITNVYAARFPEKQVPQEVIDHFLGKLAADLSYDYHALFTDISQLSEDFVPCEAPRPRTPMPTPLHCVEPVIQYVEKPIALDESLLDAFELAFSRHMYVKEYFKYVVNVDPKNRKDIFGDLDMLKNEHTTNFNRIANIYSVYCNTKLTEHMYVSKHILHVDTPDYFNRIVDDIISTADYEAYMILTLQAYYKKLYDIAMDDSDVNYLFKKVREMKLHPKDEKLVDILKEFKAQTDVFIEHIFTVYKRVLERQPDMYEIEEQLSTYRAMRESNIDVVDKQLAVQLAGALEFHDIIKKHIKTIYSGKNNNKDINPSRLYMVLHAILGMSNTTIDNLDERIEMQLVKT